jgi:hypothetical protein
VVVTDGVALTVVVAVMADVVGAAVAVMVAVAAETVGVTAVVVVGLGVDAACAYKAVVSKAVKAAHNRTGIKRIGPARSSTRRLMALRSFQATVSLVSDPSLPT